MEGNSRARRLEAEITLEYERPKVAEAIARAVSPDNFEAPSGLSVKTTWKNSTVFTKIISKRERSKLVATIDDLLFCVSTAEKTLQVATKTK